MEAERVDEETWLKTSLNSFLWQTTLIDRSSVGCDASKIFAENSSQRVQIGIDQLTIFCCCRVSLNSMSDWYYIWQTSETSSSISFVKEWQGEAIKLHCLCSHILSILKRSMFIKPVSRTQARDDDWNVLLSFWVVEMKSWALAGSCKLNSALRQANRTAAAHRVRLDR